MTATHLPGKGTRRKDGHTSLLVAAICSDAGCERRPHTRGDCVSSCQAMQVLPCRPTEAANVTQQLHSRINSTPNHEEVREEPAFTARDWWDQSHCSVTADPKNKQEASESIIWLCSGCETGKFGPRMKNSISWVGGSLENKNKLKQLFTLLFCCCKSDQKTSNSSSLIKIKLVVRQKYFWF